MKPITLLIILSATAVLQNSVCGADTILHAFQSGDGVTPYGNVTVSGASIYGLTYQGGTADRGTLFKMNTDGTNFGLLHSFASGGLDGSLPQGSLTLAGATLYGMTTEGGAVGAGTIFHIDTNGANFGILHSFSYNSNDGHNPQYGALTISGSRVFGLTVGGGANDVGTIFSLNTDGSAFSLLHSFSFGGDGRSPHGSLTLSGTTLYGMTYSGGSNNLGTIFSVGIDGNDFQLLHTFSGTADGGHPNASLTILGATLYGTTEAGGSGASGTVFKVDTDGTGFGLLHSFTSGGSPEGSLTLNGATLYGTAKSGGASGYGTLFAIQTDGSDFAVVHDFSGQPTDGGSPTGDVVLDGTLLYGMTPNQGLNSHGVVYSSTVPEASSLILFAISAVALTSIRNRREPHPHDLQP